MSSIQEIKEIAEELQLRGNEKKHFINKQMDKLRKFQAEKEEREVNFKLTRNREKQNLNFKLRKKREKLNYKLKRG